MKTREKSWIEFKTLTEAQKAALYEFMVDSGGVEKSEYEIHATKFKFRIELISPEKVIPVIKQWHEDAIVEYTFDLNTSYYADDEQRIQNIAELHATGNPIWPYIGQETTFKKWAKSEFNHGDGWHRLILAIRQNRPIEFLYLKTKISFSKETTKTLIK